MKLSLVLQLYFFFFISPTKTSNTDSRHMNSYDYHN